MSESVKKIDLGRGLFALIDADDYDYVSRYSWRPTSGKNRQYAHAEINKRDYALHRVIIRARPGEEVDHINRNGLDNRKENLRICTKAQNAANRKCAPNKTGYRGVSFQKGKYFAMVRSDWRAYFGTRRGTALEAARDYDNLAKIHHGDFAFLNFPEESRRTRGAEHSPALALLGAQQ